MTGESLRAKYFVDAEELCALLAAPKPPVLLDVRSENGVPDGRPDYEAGHIPGSVYVDLSTELAGRPDDQSGATPLPSVQDLEAHARRWGISDGDSIVVYDNVFGTKAGRAWLVLRWAGIEDVRILDGGYAAWLAAGFEVTKHIPSPSSGRVELSAGHLSVIDTDETARYAGIGVLLDARTAEQFHGSVTRGQRTGGHIPGSVSAPTHENLGSTGLLRDERELRQRFATLGADGSQPIAVYCGSGVSAAHELAVLHSMGLPASIYVGSFSAWSSDPARPIAIGFD